MPKVPLRSMISRVRCFITTIATRGGRIPPALTGGGHNVAPVGRGIVAGDQNGWAVVEQAAGVLQFNVAKAAHRRSLNNGSVGR